jgi:hypothetical protein
MLPVVRQMAAILALLAIGGLLGACGTSNHVTSGVGTASVARTGARARTVPGAGTGAAGRALSKAQANAFARAVNLTAADVPGFRVSSEGHEHETAAEKRLKHEMLRCTGGVGGERGLVELSSGSFERETRALYASVSSEVSVARTTAVAAKELAEIRGARVRGCLSRYLDLLFRASKFHGAVGPVSIAQGDPPAPGATGTFGWRISTAIAFRGIRVPFYMDILGFVYGPAEVTLVSSGLLRPFPAAAQQRLFSLLVKRAESRGI